MLYTIVLRDQGLKELLMMDCLHSMAPTDEEFLRYVLDAEPLPPEVQTHLGYCVICQQRLADYKELNTLLISRLYRSECPSSMDLNFFCEHLLPIDDMRRIERHVRQCPLCAAEVADIQQMLAACVSLSAPGAPPFLSSAPLTSRRVVASLVLIEPQMVTRSEALARGWPRQYRADSINVSLHLSHGSKGEIVLLGLFTRDDPDGSVDAFEGVLAELCHASDPMKGQDERLSNDEYTELPVMSARVDDLGNLVFKDVPVGTYLMILRLPDAELVIEGLTIERE
jgi:hypothetical protein